mmetsp:Transcript_9373/g.12968  ORF Transcript_9373/g.12968 Transcript_9373/m.12968 type:complete len:387 (-) Transcript_9373:165-1325(-)
MDHEEIFLQSNKKRKLFQYNDKMYRVERINGANDVTYYTCYNCGEGRINSANGGMIIVETKLCSEACDCSPAYLKAVVAKQLLVKICSEQLELTIQACYDNVRRDLEISCPEALHHFPTYLSMRTNLKRARNANLPVIPTNFAMIPEPNLFPYRFQQNFQANEQFLFMDLEYVPPELPIVERKRILCFMSISSALKLCQATKIFLDGTFKVCPPPFYQLLTICTLRGIEDEARLIPRLYVLLPSKSAHCYSFFFTQLFLALENKVHIIRNNIRWTRVSLDFENGLVAAFQQTVSPPGCPNPITLEGCHFHFAQCLYRKLVGPPINMRADYVAVDKIILRFFKKLVALAFLPTNAVALAFKSLVQSELSPPYCDLEGWHMKQVIRNT